MFDDLNNCVYRYIDIGDGNIKYIGIVDKGTLPTRHKQHQRDSWFKNGEFICQYIQLQNKSETEAMESHLIEYYHTGEWFNKSKVGWGLNSFIKTPSEYEWQYYIPEEETIFYLCNCIKIADEKGDTEAIKRYLKAIERLIDKKEKVKAFLSNKQYNKYCNHNNFADLEVSNEAEALR